MSQPTLLCDIGNVLVTFDFSIAAKRFATLCPHPETHVLGLLQALKEPLEDGQLSDADFIAQGMAAIDFQGSPTDFIAIWCDIFAPNPAILPTLKALAGRLPLYLLSNTSGLHKEHLFASYPVFAHFDDGIYSYAAKCSKPGKPIFHHTIERLELDPTQTFFIDDLAANIATAADLGFVTHRYDHQQHHQLDVKLQNWLASHDLVPTST
jgi:glucose-1-phosphatase